MTFVIAFAVFAFPALDLAGVDVRVGLHSRRPRTLGGAKAASALPRCWCWRLPSSRIISAIVIARRARHGARDRTPMRLERRKRAQTLSSVVRRASVDR